MASVLVSTEGGCLSPGAKLDLFDPRDFICPVKACMYTQRCNGET